jgi:hypothetical protein
MSARGDKDHDIAAWFGVNQGRIAEVKAGQYNVQAQTTDLPPAGSPGPKGRRVRAAVDVALEKLANGDAGAAETILRDAAAKYDKNEF